MEKVKTKIEKIALKKVSILGQNQTGKCLLCGVFVNS